MEMNVWLVAAFIDCEGMLEDSLALFRSQGAAEDYAAELRDEHGDSPVEVRVWSQALA